MNEKLKNFVIKYRLEFFNLFRLEKYGQDDIKKIKDVKIKLIMLDKNFKEFYNHFLYHNLAFKEIVNIENDKKLFLLNENTSDEIRLKRYDLYVISTNKQAYLDNNITNFIIELFIKDDNIKNLLEEFYNSNPSELGDIFIRIKNFIPTF